MKQKWTELKGEIEHLTVIFGNFSTLLSIKNGITRQEIEKEINRSVLEGVCPSISFLGTLISYPLLKISASQDTTAWWSLLSFAVDVSTLSESHQTHWDKGTHTSGVIPYNHTWPRKTSDQRELLKDGGAPFNALAKEVAPGSSQNTVDRLHMISPVQQAEPLGSLFHVMTGKLWHLNFTNYRPPSSPNFSQLSK